MVQGQSEEQRDYFHSKLLGLDNKLKIAKDENDLPRVARIEKLISKVERLEENVKFKQQKKDISFNEIADRILLERDFITLRDSEEILHYEDGIYQRGGEVIIKELAKRISDEEISRHKAKEVSFQIQTETYIEREKLNTNINYIPLLNGVYDLESKTLLNHSPEYYLTFQLPIHYDPTADCPLIKKFLSDVVNSNDVPVLQEISGYCLYRKYTIQKAIMLYGGGSNGKSIYLALLKAMLGEKNTCSVSLQDLETNRFAKAYLYGKHANLYADLSDEALKHTGTFKMLTGGDPLTAERKFGREFNFYNFAKVIASANKIPESKDHTEAFFRRQTMVPFPYTFTENGSDGTKIMDPDLLSKLTTKEELSGFFNWSLKGLERLLAKGKFSYSLSTEKIKERYIRASDSLGAFIMDSIKLSVAKAISKEQFYLAYIAYCKENGLTPKSKKSVGEDLPGYRRVESRKIGKRGNRKNSWVGIAFSEPLMGETLDITDTTLGVHISGPYTGHQNLEEYYDQD